VVGPLFLLCQQIQTSHFTSVMDINTKWVALCRILTKGQGEGISLCRWQQHSVIVILHKLAGLHPRIVFISLKVMLARCKCSLSMLTVDSPIDCTAQCSIRTYTQLQGRLVDSCRIWVSA